MERITSISPSLNVRTVFISDVHLGFPGCSAPHLSDFLDQIQCETLYLVGDIIDFWYLRKKRSWPARHSEVLNKILRKAHDGTRVVMVPGNHDETLRRYDQMAFGSLEIHDEVIHRTADGREFLVLHGDQFDSAVRCSPLLAVIGAHCYDFLLFLNRWINRLRSAVGRDYWSLATFLKHKVKNAVRYIERFEESVVRAARARGLEGIVCGHIHRAAVQQFDDVLYLNCGDWVESCTALVEHQDGRIELVDWTERSRALKPASVAKPRVVPVHGKAA